MKFVLPQKCPIMSSCQEFIATEELSLAFELNNYVLAWNAGPELKKEEPKVGCAVDRWKDT